MKKMILSGLMVFYALFGFSADEIRQGDSVITKYREGVEDLSRVRHYSIGYRGEDAATTFRRILSDAKQDGISNEVVYGLAKEIISEIEQAVSEKKQRRIRLLGAVNLLYLLGETQDPSLLPYLEEKCNSPYDEIRKGAAKSYVKNARLDAVPFVEKILSGSEEKYNIGCKQVVAEEFFEKITKAEAEKAPQAKIDAAYKMLIEQAQSVAYEGHADQIDRFLCEHLEGYRASVQREKAVTRFIASANEIAKADFIKKSLEVLKTPKADRADLSKRFSGLAEVKLEDEKQTKAEPSLPAEDK